MKHSNGGARWGMGMSDAHPSVLTAEEQDLLPSDADVQWYAEHGWYLSKQLLSDDEADALASASERFYAGHRDRRLAVRPSPSRMPMRPCTWPRRAVLARVGLMFRSTCREP